MQENNKKDMFLRCFEHKLTKNDISSLKEDDIFLLCSPSSFDRPHDNNRVFVIDALINAVIRFYNDNEADAGYYIVKSGDILPSIKNFYTVGKRYQYFGGDFGLFDGAFNNKDRYFRFKRDGKGGISVVDSIPNWNISHFLCDYLKDEDMVRKFVKWAYRSTYWSDSIKVAMEISFGERDISH